MVLPQQCLYISRISRCMHMVIHTEAFPAADLCIVICTDPLILREGVAETRHATAESRICCS